MYSRKENHSKWLLGISPSLFFLHQDSVEDKMPYGIYMVNGTNLSSENF